MHVNLLCISFLYFFENYLEWVKSHLSHEAFLTTADALSPCWAVCCMCVQGDTAHLGAACRVGAPFDSRVLRGLCGVSK